MKPISPPIGLIPQEMVNIKMGYKWNNSLYMITFHKPTISSAVSYAAKTKDSTMGFPRGDNIWHSLNTPKLETHLCKNY